VQEEVRTGIHPDYVETKVTCSCGETFTTRSTKADLHVELCSKCHPFYTGTQKLVDSGGRVQRFADKFGNAAAVVAEKEAAEREARRKATEEATVVAREAKAAKDSVKVERAAKVEIAEATESGDASADLVEDVAESVADDTSAEEPAAE
jgi:large subunit ribosomal protein L31